MISFWNGEAYDWKIDFVFDEKTSVKRKNNLKLRALAGTNTLQVNLGKRAEVNALVIKRGIAAAVSELKKLGATSALVAGHEIEYMLGGKGLLPLVIGARLAMCEVTDYKRDKDNNKDADPMLLYFGSEQSPVETDAILEANALADCMLLAIDLVNTPPNMLTPKIMAEQIALQCDKFGLSCEIFDENFISRQKMGAFWAVGSSSGNMPRLIVLRYLGDPDNSGKLTAIIGKALTFDTGGYNLKTGSGMKDMKCDMAGGAAAFGAVLALARNRVKANVIAVIPAAENRISRESFLPSDVLRTMSGRTVEIISTDAEGRLCMADAMTYAIQNEGVSRVIDIATLTGAAVQAFGKQTAPVMTNNESFCSEFQKAAMFSGEKYWLMPSHDEYYMMIESRIADIKNASEEGCGVMAAGLFMEHFAEGMPWIHLDIAGTAFYTKPGYEFQKAGATGAGIETLYALFAQNC